MIPVSEQQNNTQRPGLVDRIHQQVERQSLDRQISRRDFLKLTGLAGTGAALAAFGADRLLQTTRTPTGFATHTVSSESDLRNAISSAGSGDIIEIEAGTYEFSEQLRVTGSGTADAPIVIQGPSDARDSSTPNATINISGNSEPAIEIRGDHTHLRNIELAGSDYKGINTHADNTVIEKCDVHGCSAWAVMNNGGDNVVYRDIDSHDNLSHGADADGFNMTSGGGSPARNGLIEGCRSWKNSHDGYDMWVSESHTIRYCKSWENGIEEYSGYEGNGFKLGGNDVGGGHTVYRCTTWDNLQRGFDWNTAGTPLKLYNCTAYNEDISYRLRDVEHIVRNCISIASNRTIVDDVCDDQSNSWNLDVSATEDDLRSTDPESSDHLRLAEGSDLIDAGTTATFPLPHNGEDMPVEYEGSAPDLGAFEYCL